MNDKDVLRGFLAEHLGYVDEKLGAVVAVALTHHAHSGDVVIHTLTSVRGGSTWGNADAMADLKDNVARRHAAGIAGAGSSAQQFTLGIVRANSEGKPTATLPFVRMSPASMTGPGGSLATEAATPGGAQSQAMRLLEVIAQGTFAERGQLVGAMGQLISELRTDNRALLAGSLDQLNAMRSFVADVLEKDYRNRIDLLRFNRNTNLMMRAVDAAPMLLGLNPQMADTSFSESFLDLSQDDLADLAKKWERKSPAKAAAMMNHLVNVKKKRAEAEAELQRLKSDPKTVSMDEAEAEASGGVVLEFPPSAPRRVAGVG